MQRFSLPLVLRLITCQDIWPQSIHLCHQFIFPCCLHFALSLSSFINYISEGRFLPKVSFSIGSGPDGCRKYTSVCRPIVQPLVKYLYKIMCAVCHKKFMVQCPRVKVGDFGRDAQRVGPGEMVLGLLCTLPARMKMNDGGDGLTGGTANLMSNEGY